MSVAEIKAGRAFYEILAEDKTKQGLDSASEGLKQFGRRVATVGAALTGFATGALAGFVALAKGFADTGDVLGDAMGQTGFSGEFLQSLKYGAADVGVEFNLLRGAISKSQKSIAEAAAGGKSATKIFNLLGLSVSQLAGLSPDAQFLAIADAIAKIQNPAQRAEAAMAAFGKAGAKLLPMLNGGAQGLLDTFNSLKGSGLIFSEKDIALAGEADATFLRFTTTLKQLRDMIGAAVAPAFIAVMKPIQAAAEAVVKFINHNRGLVAGLAISIAVVGALGVVLIGLGGAAIFASMALTGFATIGTIVGGALAVITSPAFVIGAALLACAVAAGVAAYELDQLFNGGQALQFLADSAMTAWQGIKLLWQAVAGGRWDLAGKLIGDGLTLGFRGGILAMQNLWNGFVDWLLNSIGNALQSVVAQINQVAQAVGMKGIDLSSAIAGGKAFARGGLAFDTTAETQAVTAAVADLAKTMQEIQSLPEPKLRDLFKLPSLSRLLDSPAMQTATGAVGTFSSASGALLGFAAPASTMDEKQVDLLGQIRNVLEDIDDGIGGLEGLTAD